MSDHFEQPQASQEQLPKKPRTRLWLVTSLVIAVFLAIPYWYTANPKSCTRCHEMDKYYKSWKASSHVKPTGNCFACHVKPGAINLFVYRVSFYREIYASMVGAKLKPIGASIPTIDCCQSKGCHSLNRVSSTSGDIKISHRGHATKAHLSCTRCHPGAAHPNVGRIGAKNPPRKMCKGCHQARMNDCSFCHMKSGKLSEGYRH